MDINDRYKVGKAMREHGGSFVHALGQAIAHADGENCRRIMQAFPEYWAKYTDLADLGDSVFDCQKAQDDIYPTPNATVQAGAVATSLKPVVGPRPHICGDPSDPCDQDCMDRAYGPDDDEDCGRCDQCGKLSHCILNGLCPMCYKTGGGVLHRRSNKVLSVNTNQQEA